LKLGVISLVSERPELQEGEWLTLPQAAQKLGVSVITLRRRLKENQFEAKQVPSRSGPQWMIRLDQAQGSVSRHLVAPHQVEDGQEDQAEQAQHEATDQADKGDQTTQQPLLEALRLIRELQEENRNLAGQLGFVQAQLLQSQQQLEQAQERVLMLEAPKVEVSEQVSHDETVGWWRRWWNRVNLKVET